MSCPCSVVLLLEARSTVSVRRLCSGKTRASVERGDAAAERLDVFPDPRVLVALLFVELGPSGEVQVVLEIPERGRQIVQVTATSPRSLSQQAAQSRRRPNAMTAGKRRPQVRCQSTTEPGGLIAQPETLIANG